MAGDKLKNLYADLHKIQNEIMRLEAEQQRMRTLIKYCQTGDSRYVTIPLFSLIRRIGI